MAACERSVFHPTAIVFLVIAGIAIVNFVASVCVMRSAIYSNAQKGLQIAFVWVVPLLGAAVVLGVWAHDRNSVSGDSASSGEGSPCSITTSSTAMPADSSNFIPAPELQ
jgi:hypothetical protein